MINKSLEIFVANASYRLATEILDKYEDRGFYANNEEDLKEIRKINTLTYVLEELGDERWYKLSKRVHELTKFPPELTVVK